MNQLLKSLMSLVFLLVFPHKASGGSACFEEMALGQPAAIGHNSLSYDTQKAHLEVIKGHMLAQVNWLRETGLTAAEQDQLHEFDRGLNWKSLEAQNSWISRINQSAPALALTTSVREWTHNELIWQLDKLRELFLLYVSLETETIHTDFDQLIQQVSKVVDSKYQSWRPAIEIPIEMHLDYGLKRSFELVADFFKEDGKYDLSAMIFSAKRQMDNPLDIDRFDRVIKDYLRMSVLVTSALAEWQSLNQEDGIFYHPRGEQDVSVYNLLDTMYSYQDFLHVNFVFQDEESMKTTFTRGYRQAVVKSVLRELTQNMSDVFFDQGLASWLRTPLDVKLDGSKSMVWLEGKTQAQTNPFPFEVFGPHHRVGYTTKNEDNADTSRKNGLGIGLWKSFFFAEMNGMQFETHWRPENGGEVVMRLGVPTVEN